MSDSEKPKHTLTEVEAAEYLNVSRSVLRQGRMDGPRQGRMPVPPHVQLGRKILYRKIDLDAYLEQHLVVQGAA